MQDILTNIPQSWMVVILRDSIAVNGENNNNNNNKNLYLDTMG